MSEHRPTKYIVTDSYSKGDWGVAGIGVAYRGSRIICGDIVEAPDLLSAELLAVLRAVEIASRHKASDTVVYTDLMVIPEMLRAGWDEGIERPQLLHTLRELLEDHPRITVEYGSWESVKAARIVARQTFKAWRSAFTSGVTWSPEPIDSAEVSPVDAVAPGGASSVGRLARHIFSFDYWNEPASGGEVA